jgi:hypothetical protein
MTRTEYFFRGVFREWYGADSLSLVRGWPFGHLHLIHDLPIDVVRYLIGDCCASKLHRARTVRDHFVRKIRMAYSSEISVPDILPFVMNSHRS